MTKGSHRAGAAGLLAACVLAGVTACTSTGTSTGHSAATTPSGPQVTGRLIVETLGGQIGQLAFGADGNATYKQIVAATSTQTSAVAPVAATLSPDGTTLAYGDSHGLVLRNLRTGADKTLTPPDPSKISCVSWAPDGRHLAVGTADALYVSDQAGHMTSLYTVSSQEYTTSLLGAGTLGSLTSSFTCGTWLNPTDLVFQQSEPFPDSISQDMSSTLPADTTTVATLRTGAPPRTDNVPTQWSVLATCGTLAVTDDGPGIFLVSGLTGDVTAAQASPPNKQIADGWTSTAFFAADTCQPIVIGPGTGSGDEVAQVDPQTRHTGTSWQLPYGEYGAPTPDQTEFQWGPEPHGNVLAYIDEEQLNVVELDSGTLIDPDSAPWNDAALIIGWTD